MLKQEAEHWLWAEGSATQVLCCRKEAAAGAPRGASICTMIAESNDQCAAGDTRWSHMPGPHCPASGQPDGFGTRRNVSQKHTTYNIYVQ